MKIVYGSDWMGSATQRYELIDETISGKFVLRMAPVEMTRPDGSKYMAEPLTGIILRDKKDFTDGSQRETLPLPKIPFPSKEKGEDHDIAENMRSYWANLSNRSAR